MRTSEDSLDLAVDLAAAANDLFGAFNRNHAEARGGASLDVTSALRVFGPNSDHDTVIGTADQCPAAPVERGDRGGDRGGDR